MGSIKRYLMVVVWLALTSVGMLQLHAYMQTDGLAGSAPQRWPKDLGLTHHDGQPHVLLFIHRQCPCSKATLENLKAADSDLDGLDQLTIIFVGDPSADSRQARTLEQLAMQLTQRTINDPDAVIAERFGAYTSGHTVVYDATGSLVYSGGITPGRGMIGPHIGTNLMEEMAAGKPVMPTSRPVYGCPLSDKTPNEPTCCPPEATP